MFDLMPFEHKTRNIAKDVYKRQLLHILDGKNGRVLRQLIGDAERVEPGERRAAVRHLKTPLLPFYKMTANKPILSYPYGNYNENSFFLLTKRKKAV